MLYSSFNNIKISHSAPGDTLCNKTEGIMLIHPACRAKRGFDLPLPSGQVCLLCILMRLGPR